MRRYYEKRIAGSEIGSCGLELVQDRER